MEEIASARDSRPARAVVQIFGTCDDCRTGKKTAPIDGATTELVFARDALRMAIATERSGLEFYTRAATLTKDQRGRTVFQELAAEERHHLGILEERYRELTAKDPQLESRPTFLFFKGAASGLFDAGTEQLRGGASTMRRRCSSGSSASGARTSSSNATANGSRTPKASRSSWSLPMRNAPISTCLIREYRSLRAASGAAPDATGRPGNQVTKARTAAKSARR